jgi:hypothetical protein
MPTLHIEHSIVDFDLWNAAFGRFAEARRQAGVRDHRIQRPVDDANCVVIDLDFDTTDQAREFLEFLRNKIWASPENAPALIGAPKPRSSKTPSRGRPRISRRPDASRHFLSCRCARSCREEC